MLHENTTTIQNIYTPDEHESEKASNSYLMSLIAGIAGLPLPIINLVATLFFWLGNRKGTYFVRWHCIQALFSQLSLLFVNTWGFWWTMKLIFGSATISNSYIAYIILLLIVNVIEAIATVYAAVQTRKGIHVRFELFGDITDLVVKDKTPKS
jgi:uncharacterized membrane protein